MEFKNKEQNKQLEAKKAEIWEYFYNNVCETDIIMIEAENAELARKAEHIINFMVKVEVFMEETQEQSDLKLLKAYMEERAELERIKEQIKQNEWKIEEINRSLRNNG